MLALLGASDVGLVGRRSCLAGSAESSGPVALAIEGPGARRVPFKWLASCVSRMPSGAAAGRARAIVRKLLPLLTWPDAPVRITGPDPASFIQVDSGTGKSGAVAT